MMLIKTIETLKILRASRKWSNNDFVQDDFENKYTNYEYPKKIFFFTWQHQCLAIRQTCRRTLWRTKRFLTLTTAFTAACLNKILFRLLYIRGACELNQRVLLNVGQKLRNFSCNMLDGLQEVRERREVRLERVTKNKHKNYTSWITHSSFIARDQGLLSEHASVGKSH